MKRSNIFATSLLVVMVMGLCVMKKTLVKQLKQERELSDKHLALFLMMDQWVCIKQENKNLSEYLKKKNYNTIAIYGMSYAGKRLLEELRESNIYVKYGIDRNADNMYLDIDVVSPEAFLEKVDAVIVTSIFFISEIEKQLADKLSCPILSLEDILYEI